MVVSGDAASGLAALGHAVAAWRAALVAADDVALDTVGHSTYPDGGDAEEPFLGIVWWVNQEVLHHGAEIALLRDLYRARPGSDPSVFMRITNRSHGGGRITEHGEPSRGRTDRSGREHDDQRR